MDALDNFIAAKAGLLALFALVGPFATAEEIHVFAPELDCQTLVNLGLLAREKQARWREGYAPTQALYQ